MLPPRLQLLSDSLSRFLRRNSMKHVERLLGKARPADVAVVMRFVDERFLDRVFDALPDDEFRSETLSELDEHLVAQIAEGREIAALAGLIERMGTDDQADVVAALPDAVRDALLDHLAPAEAEEVEDLLAHAPDTAGGIMSPDFFALPEQTTAADAIAALQATDDVEMAFYVYVLSDAGHLVGVVSLRALVTHPAKMPLAEMMVSDVISASVDTDQEDVARMAARYNLLAIPVVDDANRLVGIVTIDDVIDVIREEATEDILKMAGADESAYEARSLLRNVRTRAPWLFATWAGGLVASVLIGAFEVQLERQVALAAFIPIVLGMGGNVGTQTATIMVRGLATGRVSAQVGLQYVGRELGIGVLLGVGYGILLGLYAMVRYGEGGFSVALPATVGLSILASMMIAATVGALVPLACERLNVDPAVATGPVVTTTVDVLAILVYFVVAGLLVTGF